MHSSLALPDFQDGDLLTSDAIRSMLEGPIAHVAFLARNLSLTGWVRTSTDSGFNTRDSVTATSGPHRTLQVRIERLLGITTGGRPIEVKSPLVIELRVQRGEMRERVFLAIVDSLGTRVSRDGGAGGLEAGPFCASPSFELTLAPEGRDALEIARLVRKSDECYELDPAFVPPAIQVASADAVQLRVEELTGILEGLAESARARLRESRSQAAALDGRRVDAVRELRRIWSAAHPRLTDPALSPARFVVEAVWLLRDLCEVLEDAGHLPKARPDLDGSRRPDTVGFDQLLEETRAHAAEWRHLLQVLLPGLPYRSIETRVMDRWTVASIQFEKPIGALLSRRGTGLVLDVPLRALAGLGAPHTEVRVSTRESTFAYDATLCATLRGTDGLVRVLYPLDEKDREATQLKVLVSNHAASSELLRELHVHEAD